MKYIWFVLGLIIFILIGFFLIRRNMGWYNASWTKRVKVTVDKTKLGGSDQTNFPVYVNLNNLPAGFWSAVKANGSDIVVTSSDGTTKLNRELAWITPASSTGELYFNSGSLSSTTSSEFYIYYGNSNGSESNSTATWGSNYSGVYHLNTLNDSKGTNNITNTSNESYGAVKIGNGIVMSTHNSNLAFGSEIVLSGNWSIQWWSNADNADANNVIFNKAASNTAYINYYAGNGLDVWRDGDVMVGRWSDATGFTTLKHYVLTNNSTGNIILYENATALTAKTGTANNVTLGHIGRGFDTGNALKGSIDEVRLSSGVILSASWITTEYNNQNSPSTFYTVGTEENAPVTGQFLSPFSKFW